MFAIDPSDIPVFEFVWRIMGVSFHAMQDRLVEVFSALYLLFVLSILALEVKFPAKPAQRIFSIGFLQDSVWVLIHAVGEATILVAWAVFLAEFYDHYLGFMTIGMSAEIPYWLKLILGIVIMDFFRWLQHVIQHKVPWFWQFHTVHHSQRDLNLFTDYRYHAFEYLVRRTVYFLPLMILGLGAHGVFWISLVLSWHARLYHANIKSNFGILRYILVTPQSHRVHHSIEDRHQDHNYGAFLSIWDYMFGTQCKEYDVYPNTGIRDENFPNEEATGAHLLLTPIKQMIYPFRAIGRSIAGVASGKSVS